VILADSAEFQHTGEEFGGLYDNVWHEEVCESTGTTAVGVLKDQGFAHLFTNPIPGKPDSPNEYAKYLDLAELLRHSLRGAILALRDSKDT
jgi:hypothetical protein